MFGVMFSWALVYSRFLILLGVVVSFVAFVVLLFYAALYVVATLLHIWNEPTISANGLKALSLAFIESVDALLLATVFYITSLGLYSLFIDDTLSLPSWLSIHNLDDLKEKLASVVIVVLGVLFLGYAITWDGQSNLLPLGAAIALVVTALTFFLSQKVGKPKVGVSS